MTDLPSVTPGTTVRTDDEMARLDIPALLRLGLGAEDRQADPRRALFGEGLVGAAVILDRLGVLPQSLAFLADVVRAGGAGYAAELAEPLPDRVASVEVAAWLQAAAETPDDGTVLGRWLDGVAAVLDIRHRVGRS